MVSHYDYLLPANAHGSQIVTKSVHSSFRPIANIRGLPTSRCSDTGPEAEYETAAFSVRVSANEKEQMDRLEDEIESWTRPWVLVCQIENEQMSLRITRAEVRDGAKLTNWLVKYSSKLELAN